MKPFKSLSEKIKDKELKYSLKLPLYFCGSLLIAISFFKRFCIYSANSQGYYIYFIAGCIMYIFIGINPVKFSFPVFVRAFVLFLSAPMALLMPFHLGIGIFILSIYIMCGSLIQTGKYLYTLGVSISIIALLFLIIYHISPSMHASKLLLRTMQVAIAVFGIRSTVSSNFLMFIFNGETYKFAISYEQSGAWIFLIIFLTGIIYILASFNIKVRNIIKYCAFSLAYFVLRYAVLLFIYTYEKNISVFFSSAYTLFSWLPYCLCAPAFILHSNESLAIKEYEINLDINSCAALLSSFSVLIFIFYAYSSSGIKKDGAVYIDEYHSPDWETVYQKLDRENYGGQKSTYSLMKMLEKQYKVSVINRSNQYDRLTPSDVLIIKTPTIKFNANEIAQIDTFIKSGGGVLLIGDHTDLLNMDTHLNAIANNYGINFNFDSVYELDTGNLVTYSIKNQPILHTVSKMTGNYEFATACSLKSTINTAKIMTTGNTAAELQDLSHQSYFGDLSLSEEEYFGLFDACIAKKIGKGRIIAYADSTTFSSFSMHMSNNPEFIFSCTEYLRHMNILTWNYVYAISALLLVVPLVIIAIKQLSIRQTMIWLIITAYIIPFSLCLINTSSMLSKTVASKLSEIPAVYFLSGSEKQINHFINTPNSHDEYSSLFIAFQRMGLFPRESDDVLKCIETRALQFIIVLNPAQVSNLQKSLLISYVAHGGTQL